MFGLGLIGDCLHPFLKLFFIKKVVVLKGVEVAIEFEDQGASSWDVIADDVGIGHLGEMLYNGAKRVTMGNHDHTLAGENLGADLVVPVGEDSINGNLKGFSCWEDIERQAGVARVKFGVSLIIQGKLRGRHIKAASPQLHLFLSMLGSGLSLVEALKSTIMTFVKSPMLLNWDVMASELTGDCVICHNGASENGSVSKVELITFLLE